MTTDNNKSLKHAYRKWHKKVLKTLCLFAFTGLSATPLAADIHPEDYQLIPQEQLVYMDTSEGQIVIQLLPQIAPKHAERFRNLVKENWYQGLDFYRVVDGFVAQAGDFDQTDAGLTGKKSAFKSDLKAELTQPLSDKFILAQSPEFLAPETGYIDSVPAGRDKTTNEQWFLHCPGTIAMARNNDINTGSTEFYITIGQAPRHLDRNMTVFARVVQGLDVVQRMPRGDKEKSGFIPLDGKRATITSVTLGNELNKSQQKSVMIEKTSSKNFQQKITQGRFKTSEFFVYQGLGVIDVCYTYPKVVVK